MRDRIGRTSNAAATAPPPGRTLSRAQRHLGPAALLALALLLGACGGDNRDDVATDQAIVPDVTPAAAVDVPQGREEAQLVVQNGRFGARELILQQNLATFLRVENRDDQAYRLEIDGLVDPTPVAAATTTTVELTAPDPGEFEGRLLPTAGDEAVATLRVAVEAPAGDD